MSSDTSHGTSHDTRHRTSDREETAEVAPPASRSESGGPLDRLPTLHRRGAAVVMLGLAALGLIAGLVLNLVVPTVYTASTTVLVQWRPADAVTLVLTGSSDSVSDADLADVAGTVVSPAVLESVSAQIAGSPSTSELSDHLSAEAVSASHLVTIKATDSTSASAVTLAQTAASALVAEQQAEVKTLTSNLPVANATAATAAELQARALVVAARVQPVVVLGEAKATKTAPTTRTPIALAVVGFAFGGLIVIALTLRRRRPGPTGSAEPW